MNHVNCGLKKLAPSSKANKTPPTGAPKARRRSMFKSSCEFILIKPAATPAAAPAETKSRLCLSVRKYLKI